MAPPDVHDILRKGLCPVAELRLAGKVRECVTLPVCTVAPSGEEYVAAVLTGELP